MTERKVRLPELILARLALGAVPIDGLYWYERQGRTWLDRSRERDALRADGYWPHRACYSDTD